jgi:hypothetical protein
MHRLRAVRTALGIALLCVVAQPIRAHVSAQASKGVAVCLGTDNVLRYTAGPRCPQAQRMFRLAEVEDEVGVAKERDEPTSAVVADLKSKIDFLTRRVANLENEARSRASDPQLPTQVKAPFEVVDRSGTPIFVVADGPHQTVTRKGRIEIARAAEGSGYSMLVRNAAGANLLGLGQLADGGALYIADAAGATRIFGSGAEGLKILNKSASPVVHLAVGSGGAGQFWLYDAGGRPMVSAGTDGAIGIVQTGPNNKCTPQAGLRVGDCLRGRP